MRVPFLTACVLSVMAAGVVAQNPGPTTDVPRGNVLILLADDLGVDAINAYHEGSAPPATPNIDNLATEGVLFRNVWANPVCSPTRATIMTGRYSFRTGLGWVVNPGFPHPSEFALDPSEVTLPEMLDGGAKTPYSHAAFGKWHLGGTKAVGGLKAPNEAGFSHFAGTMASVENYYHWVKVEDGFESVSKVYATTDTIDSALAWIQQAPEPWLCYVGLHAAHMPLHKPPSTLHTVDFTNVTPVPGKDPLPYWQAMVEAMDTEIGRLIKALPEGTRKRTTILFIGDNGTLAQAKLPPFVPTHCKGTLYEGGINVPFIVSSPLVKKAGTECAALVNTTDVFATVAEIAGVDLEGSALNRVDSVSIVPYLEDPQQPSLREHVFSEIFHFSATDHTYPPACATPTLDTDCECEENFGFGGPGQVELSICGEDLGLFKMPDLRVEKAPPFSCGIVLASPNHGNLAAMGGTLVPSQPFVVTPFLTGPWGKFESKLIGGLGGSTIYYQALVLDFKLPLKVAFSNAVKAQMYGGNVKAVRDSRFKLVVDFRTCEEWFYDLLLDPFEQNPRTAKTKAEKQALTKMKAYLAKLLN